MNDNHKIIRDLIRKESLRKIKESQASFLSESSFDVSQEETLEKTMEKLNRSIDQYAKDLDKFNKDERSAIDKEDFAALRDAKLYQYDALKGMINNFEQKLDLLKQQKEALEKEMQDIDSKGANAFNNQEMDEFSNEKFKKGWVLRIETDNHFINLVKQMDETNNYKVIGSNIPGLQNDYVAMIPNLKVAHGGELTIYAPEYGKYRELDNKLKIHKITRLIKNPVD